MTPPEPEDSRPSWLLAPGGVLMGLAFGLLVSILVQAVGHQFGSPLAHPTPAVELVSDYLFDLSFVAAALYLAVVRRGATGRGGLGRADFGYRRIPWRLGVGVVVLAGVAYYGVSFLYGQLVSIHGTEKLPTELGTTHSTAAAIATAVFVCAVAPMCEEFFFRGFLFAILSRIDVRIAGRPFGTLLGSIVIAILFGLAHSGSAASEYLIPLGLLGFVLCLVRWFTGSLYPCMAIHAINNSLALGVNELHWGAGIIGLVAAGALATIAAVTAPLSRPAGPAGGRGRPDSRPPHHPVPPR